MEKFKFMAVLSIMMLMLHGLYAQYTGQVDFIPADVNFEQTEGWDVATIDGCYMETDVGKPYLPVKHLHIAIPEDKGVVDIEILNIQQQELTGTYNIMPTQPGQIPGEPEPDFVDPDPAIYNVNEQYPVEYIYSPTAGFKSGVHIAGVLYYPLTYNPVTQKLYLATHLEYQLVYADEDNTPVKPCRMLNTSFLKLKEEIKAYTENPSDVETYFQVQKTYEFSGASFAPDEFPNFNGQAVEYVIITNETLAEGFQEIADWKIRKGVPAVVRTVEWIYSYYPGVDQAEKVRNFIIDAFQNWGALYYMLGGDSEQVPIRFAWMGPYDGDIIDFPNGHTIPADMYFACLDGNWNADGDATYGEANWDRQNDGTFDEVYPSTINLDNVDREPEVYIGRVPVEDYLDENDELIELNRFKTKFFEYIKTSQGNENNCLLFSSLGNIGYTLKPAFPAYMNFEELYSPNATNMQVLDELNGTGPTNTLYNMVCALGHGGPTSFDAANGSLNRTHMDGLLNTDRSQILYLANHCTTMPWNKNTVTEHYLNSENGGVSVIANTSIGWTSMVGEYNKPFIQNIYNDDHLIGNSFNHIKTLFYASSISACQKRLQFFALSLASDPEMPVWTEIPDLPNPLLVNVPTSVHTGQQTIQVQIDILTTGTEAKVCLYRPGEIYAVETITGTGGTVTIDVECTPDTEDNQNDIMVTVTAQNYLPVETSIPVFYNPGIHLFVSDVTIDDDAIAPSNGNADGLADAGETAELVVSLTNNGLTNALGGTAVLTYIEPDPPNNYITVIESGADFDDITSLSTIACSTAYVISISTETPDQYLAAFELSITDGQQNTYTDEIYIEIHAPDPQLISNVFTSTGEYPEIIEANDEVSITFEFYNGGSGMASGLTGELTSTSAYVANIGEPVQPFGDIPSHTSESNPSYFEFDVTGDYAGETIEMLLTLTDNYGKEWEIPIDFDKPDDIAGILWESTHESITLFWDPVLDEKGYNIYRCNTIDGDYGDPLNQQIITGFSGYTDYGLNPRTIYYYKVSCVSHSGIEGNLSAPEETWTSLPYHADWPNKEISIDDFGGRTEGSPMTADFDADGNKEIYFTISEGPGLDYDRGGIFGFYHDGEEIYDIDQNPTEYGGFYKFDEAGSSATPVIGDLDNDNVFEIITTTHYSDGNDKRKIFIHSTVDSDQSGEPDFLWSNGLGGPEVKGAVLSDIDNNGSIEIMVKARWGAPLYVLNGSDYSNYPGQWPVDIDASGFSMPVAANINNSGDKEIIIGYATSDDCDAGIYVFKSNGDPYITGTNGLFYQNGPAPGEYDRMDSPVTIADIYNNDPYDEIICVSGRNVPGYPVGRVFILNYQGDFISGWEYDDHTFSLTNSDPGKQWLPVTSAADINGDGNIEVLIASDEYIYIWEKNGSNFIEPIYVQGLEAKFIAPLIADVDEDDDVEIIIASNGSKKGIYCFDTDGQRVLGWPLRIDGIFSTPCIDDIDNDGKNEIIATSGVEVHVWDTEGDADKVEWGKYRHDRYNSGVYGDFCPHQSNPETITGVVEWTENKILQSDLIVEPNAKLTIYGNVALPEGSRIIVKPEGELVLDGCKLTKACIGNWEGIEVRGDPASSNQADQGLLTILNETVIEHADVAVRNHHFDQDLVPPVYFQGGVVHAFNSTFINNDRALDFRKYKYNSHIHIESCDFIYDESYSNIANPGYFVRIRDMQDVEIIGCDFRNNTGIDFKGRGIYIYRSQVNIKGKCISISQPCTEWENGTFVNLSYGIYAMDKSGGEYVDIQHNTFDHCQRGIYISGMDGAWVTSNEFYMPVSLEYDIEKYGLYLNTSTGYHIEANTFKGPSPSELGRIGIYVNESGDDWNQIYNNMLENLRQGILAFGDNRYETELGLCIKCNDFANNINDIVVNGKLESEHGIAFHQGFQGNHDTLPAGNTFTQDFPGLEFNYYNADGMGFIDYVYHGDNGTNEKVIPHPFYSTQTMHISPNPNAEYTKEGACPSKLDDNSGHIEDDREGMAESDSEIGEKEAQLAALVDGGDTEEMNFDVLLSVPPEAGEVYQDLMNQSPFLSDTVMKTAIYKENVLPNVMIRNVLVANPQSAKDNEVMSAVDERFDPMPQWMKDQVLQGVNITGAKEAIEAELAMWKQKRGEHFNNLYQYYRKDTIDPQPSSDTLEMLLTDDPYLFSKYRLAFFYYNKQDYNAMNNVLNNIPSGFDLTNTQQAVHQDYLSLYNILEQLEGNELLVDSVQASQLEILAEHDDWFPGAYARDILIAAGLMDYEEPIILPDILKSSEVIENETFGFDDKPEVLNVFPNPAEDYIIVDYNTEGYFGDILLSIIDLTGKPVYAEVCSINRDQKVVNTKDWKAGVYLITLYVNGRTIESKKVSIR